MTEEYGRFVEQFGMECDCHESMKKNKNIMPVAVHMLPLERVEKLIHLVRGQKVLLDFDLATLYGVETKVLNQAVKRNLGRFPEDFMFQLSQEEAIMALRSQIVTSKLGAGGRRYCPYAFTEQGVAMLSSVLHSSRAIRVNIEIMRAFVRLRQWLASNAELAQKLKNLEKKFDKQFKVVFEAIHELMDERVVARPRREIGFHAVRGGIKPRAKARIKNLNARTGHKA